MKQLKNKLAETAGETIAEVLVASLIAGLGLLLLASLITASKNMILKSEKTMKSYYGAVSKLEKETEPDSSLGTVKIKDENDIFNTEQSISVQVYSDTDSNLKAYKIYSN